MPRFKPGDQVVDDRGHVAEVLGLGAPNSGRPTYLVRFAGVFGDGMLNVVDERRLRLLS